ncbi:uncharacterized protein LOC105694469 isoform X2 [Orussus abietinus]|nr:uncharacterized protein LOC105694469 isoform X2 [Orussus abietinus]
MLYDFPTDSEIVQIRTENIKIKDVNKNEHALSIRQPKTDRPFKNESERTEYKYFKRLLNILLANAHYREEGDITHGTIYLRASYDQLEILENFIRGKASIKNVDAILNDVFPKEHRYWSPETLYDLKELVKYAFSYEAVMVLCGLYLLYLFWRGQTVTKLIMVFLVVAFFISYHITWQQLVMEAKIKLTIQQSKYQNAPDSCFPHKMSTFQWLRQYFVGSSECEEYYTSIMTNPVETVTPIQVLTHLCSSIVLTSVPEIATAFGLFVENATAPLPWPLSWIMKTLLYIGIPLIFIFLVLCLSGYGLSVKLGPILNISFSRNPPPTTMRQPIEILPQVPIKIELKLDRTSDNTEARAITDLASDYKMVKPKIDRNNKSSVHTNEKRNTKDGNRCASTAVDGVHLCSTCASTISTLEDMCPNNSVQPVEEIGSGDA